MRSRFYQSLMQRGSEERMVLALGAAVSISIGVAEYREGPASRRMDEERRQCAA